MKKRPSRSPSSSSTSASNHTEFVVVVIVALSIIGIMFFLINKQSLLPKQDNETLPSDVVSDNPQALAIEKVAGKYTGTGIDAAAETPTTFNLTLESTGAAFLEGTYLGRPVVTRGGSWKVDANSTEVTVTLTQEEPVKLLYTPTDGTLRSEASAWDGARVILIKQDGLTSHQWEWQDSVLADGTNLTPRQAGVFALTFGTDGSLTVKTDCNGGRSNYNTTTNDQLQITAPMATTMKFCEGSQETEFMQQLVQVESYRITDNTLMLNIADDSLMYFNAIVPATNK